MNIATIAAFSGALLFVINVSGQQSAVAAAQGSGQIQGKVIAAKSAAPIGSVTVSTYRITPSPVVLGQSAVAKDGTFTIGALPSGHYNLCVADASRNYADPCEWGDASTQIDVNDGKVAGPITLNLKAVSVFLVHVNDLANALAQTAKDTTPPRVLVTIRAPGGALHLAVEANQTASGIDYQMMVPFDTHLRLYVQSSIVALETSSHAAVPAPGIGQDVLLDSSKTQQPTFVFNATGRIP